MSKTERTINPLFKNQITHETEKQNNRFKKAKDDILAMLQEFSDPQVTSRRLVEDPSEVHIIVSRENTPIGIQQRLRQMLSTPLDIDILDTESTSGQQTLQDVLNKPQHFFENRANTTVYEPINVSVREIMGTQRIIISKGNSSKELALFQQSNLTIPRRLWNSANTLTDSFAEMISMLNKIYAPEISEISASDPETVKYRNIVEKIYRANLDKKIIAIEMTASDNPSILVHGNSEKDRPLQQVHNAIKLLPLSIAARQQIGWSEYSCSLTPKNSKEILDEFHNLSTNLCVKDKTYQEYLRTYRSTLYTKNRKLISLLMNTDETKLRMRMF